MLLVLAAVAIAAAGWTAYQGWRLHGELVEARSATADLRDSVDLRDQEAADEATGRLRVAAAAAADRTGGRGWALLTHLPLVGDDATGVRAVARSLDLIASGGVAPLSRVLVEFDHVTREGRVDLAMVHRLESPIGRADGSFAAASDVVADLDTAGYLGFWRSDITTYVEFVTTTERALSSASAAMRVLPAMVGEDGPRDYLLVFENNAEIRATGGLPGSWAVVHADHGRLTMGAQGSGGDLGERATPVLALSPGERRVYGRQLGTEFRDATFTPDFPRAARLMAARWQEVVPGTRLDGVVSLDTVALSYLLNGIGYVPVNGVTLTAANAVDTLLNRVYLQVAPSEQDAAFEDAARAIFDTGMEGLVSARKFVRGLDRAAGEGRFRVFSFHDDEAGALAGSRVAGVLAGADGTTPHVDVTVNDTTGSKMSYYLRYAATVRATSCAGDTQSLLGRMTVDQTLSSTEAATLPDYLTGGGAFGVEAGSQLVLVRVFGPAGGAFARLEVDGRDVLQAADSGELDGRPVATLAVQLWGKPVRVEWLLTTGPGQTGGAVVGVTPSIVPGSGASTVPSAC